MKIRRRILVILFAFIVLIGVVISYIHTAATNALQPQVSSNDVENSTFQYYFWQEHITDIMIQIGLLLAGAFGVAALLPAPDEEV